MPRNGFQVAAFGAGRIGNVHARNIAEHTESRVKCVVDPAAPVAETLARRVGAQVADQATALGDPRVDAIAIGTVTSTHAGLIERGLEAGKAVFCEKWSDLSMARVDAVMQVVARAGKPLFLAFNRRFDPGLLDMKRRLLDGEIGSLVRERGRDATQQAAVLVVERYAQSYRNEWAYFVRVLKGEEQPSATGEHGRAALCRAEAVYESLSTGRRVDIRENGES
jgi:predicted dehydrogenase